MRVFVVFGFNKLINAAGPVGVASTMEKAELLQKENAYIMDESKIIEYEVDGQVVDQV